MFGANKTEKKLKALRHVLVARLSKLKSLGQVESRLDEWSQGYVEGQKEVYEEIIGILDNEILILEPKK